MASDFHKAEEARTELYEIMQQELPFEEKARRALALGESYLEVQNAHLTRIDERIDFWESIASTDPPDGDFPVGEVLDLQTTYCRRVIGRGGSIALSDAPNQGWAEDPAFKEHGLHCYHGTPLTVDGRVFGTLCFVSTDPREKGFSEAETLFAELMARMLEHEVRIERKTAELNLQSNLISVLSRVLRHNLRNDLNVIRGHLSLMADRADGEMLYRETVANKIDKLVDIANTARQIESIASSKLDRQPIELTVLVEHVIDRVGARHPEATFSIDGPSETFLEAIPTLRTALEELIENGAKHSGDNPKVSVSIASFPDEVVIEVFDNGPGLPQQEQVVLREGAETPLIHGSGLGLWLTYWIVANHDGSIDAEVTEQGTRVTVRLPKMSSITDFVDSETLLSQFHSEQDKFEAIFEESFDAIVIADDDGRYVEVNDSAAELFGLSREDLLGRSIGEFTPDGVEFEGDWSEFMEGAQERGTYRVARPDGSERTVEYTAVTDIVPGQHLAILRDVTDRIERERRNDAMFNNMYQFMGVLEPDGTLVEANETALKFGGLERADVIGEKMWDTPWFQHSETTRLRALEAVRRAAQGQFTRQSLTVQGAERDAVIDFSVQPVLDEDGNVTLLIPEGRDMTDFPGGEEVGANA